MKLFGRELERRAKTLLILVAVLLVSAGLCGLQLNARVTGGLGEMIYILLPLGVAELLVMFISAAWILILSMAWGAETLYQRFGKPPKDEVQKLFEDKERKDPR